MSELLRGGGVGAYHCGHFDGRLATRGAEQSSLATDRTQTEHGGRTVTAACTTKNAKRHEKRRFPAAKLRRDHASQVSQQHTTKGMHNARKFWEDFQGGYRGQLSDFSFSCARRGRAESRVGFPLPPGRGTVGGRLAGGENGHTRQADLLGKFPAMRDVAVHDLDSLPPHF